MTRPSSPRRGASSRRPIDAGPQGRLFEDAPRITAVSADPRDPNLRRVRVGRRTVAVIPASDAAALELEEGTAWDAALRARVSRITALDRVRRAALRSLARSAASGARLVERLVRSGHDEALARDVVEELTRDGWLDEEEVAGATANSLQRRGRLPREELARRLEARGLPRARAERAAQAGAAPGLEERVACRDHAARLLGNERRARRSGDIGPATIRRIGASLLRLGFDRDTILRALGDCGVRIHTGQDER